jgi:hypothetical protein
MLILAPFCVVVAMGEGRWPTWKELLGSDDPMENMMIYIFNIIGWMIMVLIVVVCLAAWAVIYREVRCV